MIFNTFRFAAGVILISATLMTWAFAASYPLSQTFSSPTATAFDDFGFAVALDGNNALISSRRDDTSGFNIGLVYLFDTITGAQLQTFADPTSTMGPHGFGSFSTSIDIDGNNVVIGAPLDDTSGFNVGQAYLYDATTGNLLQTFNDPTPTPTFILSDSFGSSVAVSGNNVLIGARGDDTLGDNVGQAHLFDAATGNLLQTFDNPAGATGVFDFFGSSIAIDGDNVLIGAAGNDALGNNVGQAHLFDAVTGNLLKTFNDPTVTTNDQFGASVAVNGNFVLIGANQDDSNGTDVGQAYLFDATTGLLLRTFDDPNPASGNKFGSSVTIDGNKVLIGSPFDDANAFDSGQAYLFDILTGNLLATFGDPTSDPNARIGASVALSGGNVLFGSNNQALPGNIFAVGEAYLFTAEPLAVVPLPAALPLYGTGLAIMGFVGWRRKRRKAVV